MKETKTVSVNAIEDVMKNEFHNETTIQWHGVDIVVKKTISLQNAMEFVNQVVNGCFSDADGDYMPELKDYAIRACMIEKYTNIRLPENTNTMYNMMYQTDLCEHVCAAIDKAQFTALVDAINEKLDFEANAAIKKITQLAEAMNTLTAEYEKMFSNVTPEDIQAVTNAIANGVDEKKLMQAYVDIREQKGTDADAVMAGQEPKPKAELRVVKESTDGDA